MKFREIETRIAEKNELEKFREMYSHGRPISTTISRLSQKNYVEPESLYSLRNALPPSHAHRAPIYMSDRALPKNQKSNNYINVQLTNEKF